MIPNIFSLLGESIVGKHIAKGIIFSNSPKKFHPNGSRIQVKIYKNYNIVVSPLNRAEITSQLIQEKIKYMEAGWFTILNQKYANK